MKNLVLFILSFIYIYVYSQNIEKETVYIKYDSLDVSNSRLETNSNIYFSLKPYFNNVNYDNFEYEKLNNVIKNLNCELQNKLIKKEELNKKFNEYLIKLSSSKFKNIKERNVYLNAMKSMPNFNNAFKDIYIYDVNKKLLYKVKWLYNQ